MHALVLDDNEETAAYIGKVLAMSGVSREVYFDPLLALPRMDETVFDCAFIDLNLPNMDGFSFAERFHFHFPEADIVLITGYGDYDKAVHAIKIGAYDFIRKPFAHIDITMCLARLIEKRRLCQDQKRVELLKFANEVALQLAHEMRNPLAVIGGFSRRITDKSLSPEELKGHAKRISEETTRLESVVDKILASLRGGLDEGNNPH